MNLWFHHWVLRQCTGPWILCNSELKKQGTARGSVSPRYHTSMPMRMQKVPVSMEALILCFTMPLLCTGSLPKGIFSFAIWFLASSLALKPLHHATQDYQAPAQWSFVTSLSSLRKQRPPALLPHVAHSWLTAPDIMKRLLLLSVTLQSKSLTTPFHNLPKLA